MAARSLASVSAPRSLVAAMSRPDLGMLLVQVVAQLGVEARDVGHRHVVRVALGGREDDHHLVLHRPGHVLRLVQRGHQPLAAGQGPLGLLVELRAELGEGLQFPELGEVEAQGAGHLLHGLDLGVAAHAGHRDTHVDGRPDARVEQVALQEDLPVGDGDHVGGDVGGDVAGLGLDDRQGGQRAAALLVAQLAGPLQQAAVQVEDVAREGFAARRAAQQQRHLPVGVGVLGEVVVDAEGVPARVGEVLAHGRAGVGSDVAHRAPRWRPRP